MPATEVSSMPFIKNLASSDRNARIQSIGSLQGFLKLKKQLSFVDAQKLWKGLYYALWMTDRTIPQQNLANDLANLVFCVKTECVASWLTGFWAVMSVQWTDIDVLRMEKFLLLTRRVFAAQVHWIKERRYKGKEVDAILEDAFRGYCFEEEGDLRKVPVGLRLHCLDIWIDELEKAEVLGDEKAEKFVKALGDMVEKLRVSPVKPVRERARDCYDDERLPWGKKDDSEGEEEDEDMEDGEDEEWGGLDD